MKEDLKKRHDTTEYILKEYQTKSLPSEFVASLLGCDVFDFWRDIANSEQKFKSCTGEHGEQYEAICAVRDSMQKGCVIDALTLHIIYILGFVEVVKSVFGEIYLTESSLDLFKMKEDKLKANGINSYMFVSWRNGQIIRDEISVELIKAKTDACQKEFDWVKTNTISVIAESVETLPDEIAKLRDAISLSFFDPVLAAKDTNKLLLCEDGPYRKLAIKNVKIRGAWLQPVLAVATEEKIISPVDYIEAVSELIQIGHGFTSINSQMLQKSIDVRFELFEILAASLFVENAEIHSHASVMKNFLTTIWSSQIQPSLQGQAATSILLSRIFFGEWKRCHKSICLEDIVMMLYPLRLNRNFEVYLRHWMRGHFLISSK